MFAGNGVELQIVPEIGGRIIQFTLAGKEFLWVNPRLAGKMPPSGGLDADGGWLNFGGDKLWPAPQGWDNDRQWPGPPDAVLDGQPYRAESLAGGAAARLTSRDDPRSGIRFSRTLVRFPAATACNFEATMKNIDTKPRRWGIWADTQLNAGKPDRSGFNPLLRACCPLNPDSRFPRGYRVIFGEERQSVLSPRPRAWTDAACIIGTTSARSASIVPAAGWRPWTGKRRRVRAAIRLRAGQGISRRLIGGVLAQRRRKNSRLPSRHGHGGKAPPRTPLCSRARCSVRSPG